MLSKVHLVAEGSRLLGLDPCVTQERLEHHLEAQKTKDGEEAWVKKEGGRKRETSCMLRNKKPAPSPEPASLASEASLHPYRHSCLCANKAEVQGQCLFIQVPGSTVLHTDNPMHCSALERLRESVSQPQTLCKNQLRLLNRSDIELKAIKLWLCGAKAANVT